MKSWRPLLVALVLATVMSLALFLLSAGSADAAGSHSYGWAAAPWWVIERDVLDGTSTVAVRPGLGLAMLWGALAVFGLVRSWRGANPG